MPHGGRRKELPGVLKLGYLEGYYEVCSFRFPIKVEVKWASVAEADVIRVSGCGGLWKGSMCVGVAMVVIKLSVHRFATCRQDFLEGLVNGARNKSKPLNPRPLNPKDTTKQLLQGSPGSPMR